MKGRILIYTGDGKGKTTAALGCVLRAVGHKMKSKVLSFIKSPKTITGEKLAGNKFSESEFELINLGAGFTWLSNNSTAQKKIAEAGWQTAITALNDKSIDLLVLDEITYPINFGWLKIEEIVTAIENRKVKHLIITGRNVPKKLIEIADTVTEMKNIKHGFNSGIKSTKGIEF